MESEFMKQLSARTGISIKEPLFLSSEDGWRAEALVPGFDCISSGEYASRIRSAIKQKKAKRLDE
jgi:hypothetical protein